MTKGWGLVKFHKLWILVVAIFAGIMFSGMVSQAESSETETLGITTVMGAVLETETVIAGTQLETGVAGSDGFQVEEAQPVDLSEMCDVMVQPKAYVYSGQKCEPSVSVIFKDPETEQMKMLIQEQDFLVEYNDNVNAGTAVVTVIGIGNYTGTKTAEFTIEKKSIENCSVWLAYTEVYGDGSQKTPAVKVFYDGTPLVRDRDYIVSYADNTEAGTGHVYIEGIGNWAGTITKTFAIKYDAVKELSCLPSSGMISLTWNQMLGAKGYEVFRSTALDAGYEKLAAVSEATYLDTTAAYGLTYYYKVRAYGILNEELIYGAYSEPVEVFTGNQVASIVKPYEGVKYVMGGSSPKGWDCSGFTQWIMKNKFGVDIPRTSRQQAKCGVAVDMNDQSTWLPGDLICFSKSSGVCHVALYIGDGMMMHASSTYNKTVIVNVDDYNRRCTANNMSHVRRVLK